MPDLTGVPSTPEQQIGIALISACGLLSGIVTGGLLVYLFWSAYGWRGRYSTSHNGFKKFLGTDAGRYLVSLLVADLCHAAAYTSGFHWLVEGRVDRGGACVRQAVFLQLGDMGTVLWIFILSAHTLVLLFLSRRPPVWFRPALLVLGWTVVILMPVLGPILIARPDEPFYNGGSGLWCWVNDAYPTTQVLYFFVWAMCTLGGSIICYTLVFLRTSGYIGGGQFAPPQQPALSRSRWTCTSASDHDSGDGSRDAPSGNTGSSESGSGTGSAAVKRRTLAVETGTNVRNVTRKLLLYPVAYAFVVMPLTVSSLLDMTGVGGPFWFLVLSTCIYALGGLVDALLFIFTRQAFIRNASVPIPRSGPRVEWSAPKRHTVDGITITQHELTVFDSPTFLKEFKPEAGFSPTSRNNQPDVDILGYFGSGHVDMEHGKPQAL